MIGRDSDRAALGAAVMIATHVGLRATRDALFLSQFSIDRLPVMVFAASLFSLVTLLGASRAMARWTPGRLVPIAFVSSAVLLLVEWAVAVGAPGLAGIILYLHVAALGGFLISGFWSVVNERFDPRTARRKIARIGAGAAFGGLVGGVAAARLGVLFSLPLLLPGLAVLHLAAGGLVGLLRPLPTAGVHAVHPAPRRTGGLRILARDPYLRRIGLLVLTAGSAAVLLDFVFKARAVEVYSDSGDLVSFFAVFYAVAGLGTFLVQTILGQRTLERLGLAGTVMILPLVIGLGAGAIILVPGLGVATLVRGGESVARSSLYRSGYELLYTPVAVSDKRAVKTLIDVGVDRVGDGLGAALVSLLLLLPAAFAPVLMPTLAVGLGALALVLAIGLRAGYVDALKGRLADRAGELAIDRSADSLVVRTMSGLDLSRVLPAAALTPPPAPPTSRETDDPLLRRAADLRSGVSARVRAALEDPLDPLLAGHAIALLAWDEVSRDAQRALRSIADRITGELADALLSPDSEYAVRRRIPAVLASSPSPRAVDGLVRGLEDRRFEVRARSATALARIRTRDKDLAVPRQRVLDAVVRELSAENIRRRVPGARTPGSSEARASDPGLEYIFRLLGLVMETEPLRIAYRGLHTDDPQLRGTALEYLETVLPAEVRSRLWPLLEDTKPKKPPTSRESARSKLLMSQTSIDLNLARRGGGEGGEN